MLVSMACTAQTYIEPLSRGLVAVPCDKGNFVSWRYLITDAPDASFDLIRDGKVIASHLTGATSYTDNEGTSQSRYAVVTHQHGTTQTSPAVCAWDKPYLSLPLDRPAEGVTPDGRKYEYTPNDCSVGDGDGDGEYEIILKWDPSNAHDNAHNGYTGNVIFDAYKLNTTPSGETKGDLLWRIDLGRNIRAGAHYTQFLVYDFDGDGKAEMVCKTAPGSIDGKGKYVTEAATDQSIINADNNANYVDTNGRILSGPEYLTVFSGLDGHALHTIYYNPNRALNSLPNGRAGEGLGSADYATKAWGDNFPGNRGERYLAGVAFLGGKTENPSAVMCRGYYTLAFLWAVDFDGKQLTTRWLHSSLSPSEWKVQDSQGNITAQKNQLPYSTFGQGAHSLSVGDVDDDGCDEICYGSAAIDHDGSLLYSTGMGHGDAQHLGDFIPERPGLEYFMVHEARPYGASMRDARTGEILYRMTDSEDTGRGVCADIDSLHPGAEFWCSARKAVHDVHGNIIAETEKWTPQNFRIYWDGDLYEELIGNGRRPTPPLPLGREKRDMNSQQARRSGSYYIAKWNGQGCDELKINGRNLNEWGNSSSCNGTKATPCLQADLFGDWREEIILYDASDRAHLNIFSTNIPTPYRIPTLMHDHTYRMAIAWQNVAYNQPPHLGYNLLKQTIK